MNFREKRVVVAPQTHTTRSATSQEKRQNCFVLFPPNLFNRKASEIKSFSSCFEGKKREGGEEWDRIGVAFGEKGKLD